jgi:succinyl-CoA synthetase beta subunit
MNLHEFQAKSILKKYNVRIPEGSIAYTPEEADKVAIEIKKKTNSDVCAIKAQIHAGGRGKGGGVKIAKTLEEVNDLASIILGMNLVTPQTGVNGKIVHKILVEQGIYYKGESPVEEYYLSMLLNRDTGRFVVIYSPKGGMDIELVAEKTPHLVFREEILPGFGLQMFQARKIAFNLGLSETAYNEMIVFVINLYYAFIKSDASLLEINPVVKTSDNLIFAADAKMSIDDNALFRHPEFLEMRDLDEEDISEIEASKYGLSFVKLDGNVGCMVNGAGLAMATMDIIKFSGSNPANFLDIGGNANATKVEAGFRIILKDPNVKCILINIFGGIVRCDIVAHGIVEAYKAIGYLHIPVIVRLQGTNAEEGKKIIDESGLQVLAAISLQESASLVHQVMFDIK